MEGPSASLALQQALPIVWLHVPKTGTSFMNALLHLPGVCNVSEDLVVTDESNSRVLNCSGLASAGSDAVMMAFTGSHAKYAPGHGSALPIQFSENHIALGWMSPEERRGHVFTMLRQPEQRLMSEFSWGANRSYAHPQGLMFLRSMSLLEYAEATK